MKTRILLSLTVAAGVAAAAVLYAETMNVKTGLWEVTSTTQTTGAPPVDLSNVPPERRAQIEAMMKERFGGEPKTEVKKECITKEKLEKDLFGDDDMKGECTRTSVTATATVHEVKFECAGNGGKSTGDIRIEAQSTERATGTANVNVAMNGKTMVVNS